MDSQHVIEVFISAGLMEQSQADDLLVEIENSGKPVEEVILDFGIVTKEQFYQTIAEAVGAEVFDMGSWEVPVEVQRLVPGGLARLHGALPVGVGDGAIAVALTDPLNAQIAEDLRFALQKDIQIVVSPIEQI